MHPWNFSGHLIRLTGIKNSWEDIKKNQKYFLQFLLMKFIDFFCLITSKYDFQSITSKARDSILKFEKHQMHQIRNILILRLCTPFFQKTLKRV